MIIRDGNSVQPGDERTDHADTKRSGIMNMSGSKKIGMIGGDRRLRTVADGLGKEYECAVWGISDVPECAVRCTSWQSAVKGADAVILPLPVSRDGKNLNTDADEIDIYDIAEKIRPGVLVCGGMIPPVMKACLAERRAEIFDYYDSETVQIKNAVPTAEGAVAAIIGSMPVTVFGMKVVLTGYGRCARTLAARLLSFGATVYVAARRDEALAWAGVDGCVPIPLYEYLDVPVESDIIVNTVPIKIFEEKTLSQLEEKCVYFELAGGEGGIDRAAAEKYGIKIVPLPSLPGKTSPETAGNIICSEIKRKFAGYFGRGETDE